MQQAINHALFGWYPYLCLTVFLIGSLVRFDREQYTWRTGSSQLLRRRQMMWGSNLFHVGILVIFFGHFGGLLTPIWAFDLVGVPHGLKQMTAIVAGGIAGVGRDPARMRARSVSLQLLASGPKVTASASQAASSAARSSGSGSGSSSRTDTCSAVGLLAARATSARSTAS